MNIEEPTSVSSPLLSLIYLQKVVSSFRPPFKVIRPLISFSTYGKLYDVTPLFLSITSA